MVLDLPPAALAIFKEDKVDKSTTQPLMIVRNLIGGDAEILPTVECAFPNKLVQTQ